MTDRERQGLCCFCLLDLLCLSLSVESLFVFMELVTGNDDAIGDVVCVNVNNLAVIEAVGGRYRATLIEACDSK